MSSEQKQITGDEALRQRVEELATSLVMGDADGPRWAEMLAGVHQQATAAGRPEVAQLASAAMDELAGIARTAGGGAADLEALFTANVARLQEALAGAVVATGPAPSQAAPTLGDDPEMIGDFILESREHLTQVEIQMMTLEKDPGDMEAINTVFRGFHTIKGLAGFLDLQDIRDVAHETETLLDLARNQELRINSAVVDLVLEAADFLKVWLTRLEATLAGADPGTTPAPAALLARLRDGAKAKDGAKVEVTPGERRKRRRRRWNRSGSSGEPRRGR